VFGDASTQDVDEITEQWERIKSAEKARDSVLDGIARSQPALALAAKILSRAARAGLPVVLPEGDDLGGRLLRLSWDAVERGEDAEAALRRAALALADQVRAAER
jgi:XTP/dITP diphosphohydrolase